MLSAAPAQDVQAWVDGNQLYDEGDPSGAIAKFEMMTPSARVNFNVGCCYLTLGKIENAMEKYQECVKFDKHLAIGYFMLGLTHTVQNQHPQALVQFKSAHELLRGNRFVDYRQLGFKYQLFESTILHNRAVNLQRLKHEGEARELLLEIIGNKSDPCYKDIKGSIDRLQIGRRLEPIGPPRSEIFRPPKALLANIKGKDYLGKAKVISHLDEGDSYACFSGLKLLEDSKEENNARDSLLSDLRKPEMKKKLRSTIRRSDEGQVNATESNVKSCVPASRAPPKKALPKMSLPDLSHSNEIDGSLESQRSSSSRMKAPIKPIPQLLDTDENVFIREKSNSLAFPAQEKISLQDRQRANSLGNLARGFFKKPKSPLPGRRSKSPLTEEKAFEPIKSKKPDRALPSLNHDDKPPSPFNNKPPKLSLTVPPPEDDPESSDGEDEDVCVFEVQYSFIKRVKLPRFAHQWQLMNVVQNVEVPDEVDLCFTDALGRQQQLTEKTYSKLVNLPDVSKPRLLCFPKSINE